MEYFGRNCNKEFIERFGKEIFVEVFKCITSENDTNNVRLLSKMDEDKYGIIKVGYCLVNEETVVQFSEGLYTGEEVIDFSESYIPEFLSKDKKREIKLGRLFKNQ